MKLVINYKANDGDLVNALNNRTGLYESGKVIHVEVTIQAANKYYISYRVLLDRQSKSGNNIFVYVSDSNVYPVSQ